MLISIKEKAFTGVVCLALFSFILLLSLFFYTDLAYAQEVSGRWSTDLDLEPQTTGKEAVSFDFDLSTQFSLGLDFEQLGFNSGVYFENVGLTRSWFGWAATFPTGGVKMARTKRTLEKNEWIEIIRSYPSWVAPGEKLKVTITIEALQNNVGEIVILEVVPQGWEFDPISPSGRGIDHRGQRYKVNLTNLGDKITILYEASVPTEAVEEEYTLQGTVKSDNFDDLDFNDSIKVIEGVPSKEGGFTIRSDVDFSTNGGAGTLAFSSMGLDSSMQFGDLALDNYFTLNNAGSVQTPDLEMEDTINVSGVTVGGVRVRLLLEFGTDDQLGFEGGSLRFSPITLADISFEGSADFELDGFEGFELGAEYETEIFDESFNLILDDFDINLKSLIDGDLRIYTDYGDQEYDSDDDGVEETHFELDRRRIDLDFELDDFDFDCELTFEPIFDDVDSDGVDEKTA